MRWLPLSMLLATFSGCGPTAEDLAGEAEAVRDALRPASATEAPIGPPWFADEAAEAGATIDGVLSAALDTYPLGHPDYELTPWRAAWLVNYAVDNNADGLSFSEEETQLSRDEVLELAYEILAGMLASDLGEKIDRAIAAAFNTAYEWNDANAERHDARLFGLISATLAEAEWQVGRRHEAHRWAGRLVEIIKALESYDFTITDLTAQALWMMYEHWVRERLADGEFEADDAVFHVQLIRSRPVGSPSHSADTYLYDQLIAPSLVARDEWANPDADLGAYQKRAFQLRDWLERSIDAPAAFRLGNTGAASTWHAMSSSLDDSFSKEFDPAGGFTATIGIENRELNSHRSLEALLAIRLYELDHDSLPDTLDALVPDYLDAVPVDAFCAEPMRYQPGVEGRYVLYSVGWDGVDNGGTTHPEHNQRASRAPGSFFGEYQDPTGYDERLDPWALD